MKTTFAITLLLISLNLKAQNEASDFLLAANINDPVQTNAITQLVADLKNAGLWTKMKAIYPFVGATPLSHQWNLKDCRDNDQAFRLTFIGGWTHTAQGADPDGSTGYADTHLSPSAQLSLNSSHISYYSNEEGIFGGYGEMGSASTNADQDAIHMLLNYGGTGYYRNNSSGYIAITETASTGYFINSRITSTGFSVYKNGTSIAEGTSIGSTALSTANIYIGSHNENLSSPTFYSARRCAFASIGEGLSASETSILNTIVNKYECALSRGIQQCPSNNGGSTSTQWVTTGNDINNANTGSVSIGTTDAKGYKFAVNGDAIFTKIKVKNNAEWPDFVFNKDFKLPSLIETEKFIKLNNHLPGIPSANEVEKDGIDVGTNQALLLKKIEEMTLLLIAQEKEQQLLKKIIKGQSNKIITITQRLKNISILK